jgi:hypothetical protein
MGVEAKNGKKVNYKGPDYECQGIPTLDLGMKQM